MAKIFVMKKEMFYSAGPAIFQRAKELRNHPTDAERILWMHLRTRPKGYKFRRQHPIGNYIVDFYCHALKLVIEADGSIHELDAVIKADTERQSVIEKEGIKSIRFPNDLIMQDMNTIIEKINSMIDECQR
jgi:imidazole glycerol-phosphate synthase subunit HisF